MKKRVLLLNTPFYRLMGSHYDGLSLGLLYLAAVLRENGHEVAVLNADYENRSDYLDQRGIFEGFSSYKTIHENKDHYIWEDTVARVLDFNPDILGITMYTANFKAARIIVEKVKQQNRDIIAIVGGVHPTLAPKEILRVREFDYLVVGEGEFPLMKLLNGDSPERIAGLGYKKNRNLYFNPPSEPIDNLDSLPFPARDLIVSSDNNIDYGQLITGRGCPFSCKYCSSPAMWGRKKVRFRSVENVVEELMIIKEKYPHNIIYFVDDTFTLRKVRVTELCKEILRRGLDIQWKCDTRADCLTEEMIIMMKEAGCTCVKIGVESGSEKILKAMNKKVDKATILSATKLIKKHDIPLTIYLMAGFPGETDDDLKETIRFAQEIDADYNSLSIVAPYYGTKIYDEFVRNNGRLEKEHWEYFYHQSGEMIMNHNLSEPIIEEFLSLNEGKKRI